MSGDNNHRLERDSTEPSQQLSKKLENLVDATKSLVLNDPPVGELKKGGDLSVTFNPKVKQALDVTLMHTITHQSVVCCVRFSADGKFLATGCNWTAQIYDTKTGENICLLHHWTAGKTGDMYIRSVCFSPDGKYLATAADDKRIRIWNIAEKQIHNTFEGHQDSVYSLIYSTDGLLIVSGSADKTARIWNTVDASSKVLNIRDDPDSSDDGAVVASVSVSPNGQLVATGTLDNLIRIWDATTGRLIERLQDHENFVYSLAFTPDGKGLVSGSLDKTLKYWDVTGLANEAKREDAVTNDEQKAEKDSRCTMTFTGHTEFVLSVSVSHDGLWVVSGSKDRSAQFWDIRDATVQCKLHGHTNSVISVDLSPAGDMLATGGGDMKAQIWTYQTI